MQGLGHCAACHATRDALGGVGAGRDYSGGALPEPGWHAPSLHARTEGGVAHWETQRVVDLLRDGIAQGASVVGPMAEVVFGSTQHLSDSDLRAMTTYLQALAPRPVTPEAFEPARAEQRELGARVYAQRCADCHGEHLDHRRELGAYVLASPPRPTPYPGCQRRSCAGRWE